jgi:hypothetical protein
MSTPTRPAHAAGPSLHQLTTPRAAAVAGILFAFLFGATIILIRLKMPEGVGDSAEWLDSHGNGISIATKLMPFAGITFLWFIGVVRDNLGRYEDRFFASVLIGSGLLFLAMMFVSTAIAAGLLASSSAPPIREDTRTWRVSARRWWRQPAKPMRSGWPRCS